MAIKTLERVEEMLRNESTERSALLRPEVGAIEAIMGITPDRIYSRLGVRTPDEIQVAHLEQLIELGTSIRSGDVSLDEAFLAVVPAPLPVVDGVPEGRRVKMPGTKSKANDNREQA